MQRMHSWNFIEAVYSRQEREDAGFILRIFQSQDVSSQARLTT
jgi:hypothetical protein